MTGPAKWQMEILDSRPAGLDYRWIRLAAPQGWESCSGQFINIRCDGDEPVAARVIDYADGGPRPTLSGDDVRGKVPLVRRPVSISYVDANASGGRGEIVLLVRVVGPGSRRLGERAVGDTLDVVGPLGNGFDLRVDEPRAFLVGGGCGIAPLVGAARDLAALGKEITVFYGANTRDNVPLTLPEGVRATGAGVIPFTGVRELPGATVVLATDDGTAGLHGLVTDAMSAYCTDSGWEGAAIFSCGPDVMMSAVAALARAHDVRRCQVSLENYMGCAIGVCLSCAVKIRTAAPPGWTFQRVCVDGPVFEAAEVIFSNQWEGCKR